MSSTIGDLVDRVYREYLEPMDSVESYSYLTGGISSSDTTLAYSNDMFSVEEEDALDAGAIVEVGQELMFSTALNTVTNEITVTRGARGTTAAAHSAGDLIKITPQFPRKNVFDAVVDQIENLYPTLFAVETKTLTSGTGYRIIGDYGTDVDNNNYLVAPVKAISQFTDFSAGTDETGLKFIGVAVEMVDLPNGFTWTDEDGTERTKTYTTGPQVVHALQFQGVSSGYEVFVTFKKKFIAPTAETDTLVTVGLESEYEPIVMAGVAAQMIAGKDIKRVDSAYITEQLSVQNFPAGTAGSIRNNLLQYQNLLIQQARKNLRAKYPEPVVLNSINYPI
ncbi:hypothetical protein N8814_05255 [Acidimicrobiia bacterium]|nr:hypothetical protein [Acidimicrobiia bacterium]